MRLLAFLGCVGCVSAFGYFGNEASYDETAMGDLPNGTAPYSLGVVSGDFSVTGIVGLTDFEDAFTFTVPDMYVLSSLPLVRYEDPVTGADGNLGFLHINQGTTSFTPDVSTLADMLGGIVLLASEIGDLLPKLANATLDPDAAVQVPTPPLGQGFTPPLPAGDYSINVFNGRDDAGNLSDRVLYEVVLGITPT